MRARANRRDRSGSKAQPILEDTALQDQTAGLGRLQKAAVADPVRAGVQRQRARTHGCSGPLIGIDDATELVDQPQLPAANLAGAGDRFIIEELVQPLRPQNLVVHIVGQDYRPRTGQLDRHRI